MFGDRLIRVAHHAFVLLLVVWSAIALTAQTVVDPRFVEFTPSADHNTLASDGTPIVQRYSLTVFVVGSPSPLDTMDLGKPAPSAGIIRVDFLPLMHTPPPAGVILEARVTAIGPGGSTAKHPIQPVLVPEHVCPEHQLDECVRGRRHVDRQRWRDGGNRLHVVGGVKRDLGHVDGRNERNGEWDRAVQRCRQHEHDGTHGNTDRGREDLHDHPGRRAVLVCDRANESVGGCWWRDGVDECHGADRMCVDRRQ